MYLAPFLQVGLYYLASVQVEEETMRDSLAKVFSAVHISVEQSSDKMLAELKRHNYITPTHFLELVKGYKNLLAEKREELGQQRDKLGNGLAKLVEARDGVTVMSAELEKKKVIVAQKQKDCEGLLVVIVSERRAAEEQKKTVEADSERIGKEAIECDAIARDAQADLDVALPALEKAMAEVDKLDKGAISEVKAYAKPPGKVEKVMQCVCIYFNKKGDWDAAKKLLGESNFLQQIKSYDKDNVSAALMNKIKKYIADAEFTPEAITAVSKAAGALCTWCHAIYIYANVAKEVAPKRNRLKAAQDGLAIKQAGLAEANKQLAEVVAKVEALKKQYDDSVGEKNALKAEADSMETLLDRADKLVKGLAGEYDRWQKSIGGFQQSIANCVGDVLVSSASLSYLGPFDTLYRDRLTAGWLAEVKDKALPFTEHQTFAQFCARAVDVRGWQLQGLPADNFSTENGVVVTRCNRWPLMVDPQGQANKWVRRMEEPNGLRVIDLKMKDFLRDVETGISYGLPLLLQASQHA
jgi:dynein heavy chain